ncbi:hypothetical protein GW944_01080 [Candidatus Parcubacteria bacterium]|nr:hypothetical protein [Candidatus Parcubacteria bacterium]
MNKNTMEHKDKKLELDLDFLGEGAPEKSEKKHDKKDHSKTDHKIPAGEDTPMSDGAKWTLGAIAVAVLIIIIAASSSGGDSNSTASSGTLPPPANTETLDNIFNTSEAETNSYVPVAERTKTANQQCKDNYGVNAYSTGEKNADGGPVCDCNDGYQWNAGQTACVAVPKVKTGLEICKERNGAFATYDSASNSCGCASGYYLGETSQQCVSYTDARDQSCAAEWPGTSFLKYDSSTGKNICDCEVGSYWNNERTACYTLSSFNQSCVNTFGTGSISTTENGKRVCDCGYGYDFNPQRNACVTTASINAICERDVGRNSRYAGSSSDGKYNCTEPY